MLVLEEQAYRYQAALSDLSGSDIQFHAGDYKKAIRKVRNWLVNEAGAKSVGAAKIINAYETDFQEWHYEKQLADGFDEDDIKDAPTSELLQAMKDWKQRGEPIGLP